jgi:hypothetical protein
VLAVRDRAELDALGARLRSAGLGFESSADELVVRDPDGIELRFVHHA